MRVFISWSGERSRQVAIALRDWLKLLIQALDPWMSDKDIESGARWSDAIAGNLKGAKVGIICVTSDNRDRAWLNFESGAVSNTIGDVFVCPYLFGLDPADLAGPLSQFQARRADKDGTLRLLQTINAHPDLGTPLPEATLQKSFETWWPELGKALQLVPPYHEKEKKGDVPGMLNETLHGIRELLRLQSHLPTAPSPVVSAIVSQSGSPTVLRVLLENAIQLPLAPPAHVVQGLRQRANSKLLEVLPTEELFMLAVAYVTNGDKEEGIRAISALTGCTVLAAKGTLEHLRIIAGRFGLELTEGWK